MLNLGDIARSPYVFISYPKSADQLAFDINHDLKSAGLSTWIDYENYTSPRERKLEMMKAVDEAAGVLVIAVDGMNDIDGPYADEIDAIVQKIRGESEGTSNIVVVSLQEETLAVTELDNLPRFILSDDRESVMGKIIEGLASSVIPSEFKRLEQEEYRKDQEKLALGQGSEDGDQSVPNAIGVLFGEDDFDLYVNKLTGETYIFHGPELIYAISHLEYHNLIDRVGVILEDGTCLDLGVKIQWLIRPYFRKAENVFIIQTKDGEALDGIEVSMKRIGPEPKPKIGAATIGKKKTVGSFLSKFLFREGRKKK